MTFEESDHLDISAADGTRIPRGETNLVYRSAKGLFDKVGKTMPPLKLVQTNAIPMARGLGSSSACIIAGLLGANPVSYTHLLKHKCSCRKYNSIRLPALQEVGCYFVRLSSFEP